MNRADMMAGTLIVAFAIGGCGSARDTYRGGQQWQREACARLPDASERERCLASAAASYEDYRRAREEALDEDAPERRVTN